MFWSKEINEAIALLTNHMNHLCDSNFVFYENKEEQSLFKVDHITKMFLTNTKHPYLMVTFFVGRICYSVSLDDLLIAPINRGFIDYFKNDILIMAYSNIN